MQYSEKLSLLERFSMSSKQLLKSFEEYRQDLCDQADESVVKTFDQLIQQQKKVAAIKLLRKYGIINEN